jgi:flavorubredoxin
VPRASTLTCDARLPQLAYRPHPPLDVPGASPVTIRKTDVGLGNRLSSADMPRLLIVHHTPSPALQEMFEATVSGARTDEVEGVEVVIRPALTAAAADVLQADGLLLGTPANIGYMSGALKHFFDGIYYPCLEATRRRPYGLYVHGGMDTGGAVRAVESITTGLQWRAVRPPVCVTGPPGKKDLEACWELGALLAAEVAG